MAPWHLIDQDARPAQVRGRPMHGCRGAADDIGAAWRRAVPVLVAGCGGLTRPEWLLRVVPVIGAIVWTLSFSTAVWSAFRSPVGQRPA
jgi:hypothetical protein